ncbi:fumarate hydratase C-terminal domain-containing protein [uncultured Thiodictyon sp.]|uniref:fumarate hydratase C-terminal domain-containing protein n=1 Tax=uncultured Thiodictyon sp. TaxID=1846217 RepID=UPI0025E1F39B|nr:fumarate hydratase C-terminal domain-containing protein [uncultured Thiodictyon sp.]
MATKGQVADVLRPPLDEAQVRALRVGDTVTLEGTLFGIRDATLIHLIDRGRTTRLDLCGGAVIHTAPSVARVPPSPSAPVGYRPVSVGTTTSARMERFTEPLMRRFGVRLIVGKGGLGADSRRAFAALGGAYLAVVGGAAALETTWVEAIEAVDLDDLHPESLWRFRVHGFGPLLVTIDSHGGDLHREVEDAAQARRADVLAGLGVTP